MTNKEIVDSNLGLIRRCVECQVAKTKSIEDRQNIDDFYHDLIITLYEYPKLVNAYESGHLNALVSRIVINNIFSKTSEYEKKYRKLSRNTEEYGEEDED